MDLNQLLNEFRQLQIKRKTLKRQKIRKIKFSARVKMEQGSQVFWATISFSPGVVMTIVESTRPNNLSQRRQLMILQEEVETYHKDNDSIEINFQAHINKPDPLIIFENIEATDNFEIAFRHFMEYK